MKPRVDLEDLRAILPELTPREVRLILVFARSLKQGRERSGQPQEAKGAAKG